METVPMKPTIFEPFRLLRALLATAVVLTVVGCDDAARGDMDARLQRLSDADAAYVTHTSDKEARALADYYDRHGDRQHRMKAHYLAGRAYSDLHDAPQALSHFQKVLDLAPTPKQPNDQTITPLLAATHSQMASLFFEQHILDEALAAYRRAYRCDSLLADTAAMVYDLRDIGNVYRASEPEDSCLNYFRQALSLAQAIGDDTLAADVQSQLAAYYVWHDDYPRARTLLAPALALDDEAARSGTYSIAAELAMRTGQTDSAKFYYRRLLTVGTVFAKQAAYRGLADIAMKQNQPGEALRCLQLFEDMTDSVTAINDSEALRRMHALYNYQLRERENTRLRLANARNRTILIAAVSAVALLAVLLVAAVQFYRRKRLLFALRLERLKQLLQQKETASASNSQPSAQPEGTLSPSEATEKALNSQLSTLNRMSQLGKMPTADDWQQLEQLVNNHYPDFTQRLFSFRKLSDHEYHVSLLLKLGVPPQTIGFLTAHTKQSVSNTRARLYEKTFGQKGKATQWDDFIDSL